jgi:hypothetical protein
MRRRRGTRCTLAEIQVFRRQGVATAVGRQNRPDRRREPSARDRPLCWSVRMCMRSHQMQIHAVGREPPSLLSDSEFWMGRERDKGNERQLVRFLLQVLSCPVQGTQNIRGLNQCMQDCRDRRDQRVIIGSWDQPQAQPCRTQERDAFGAGEQVARSHGLATKYPIP